MEGLPNRLWAALKNNSVEFATAEALAKLLNVERKTVEHVLYEWLNEGRVRRIPATHPSMWRIRHSAPEPAVAISRASSETHILIDLDHVHDCFERAAQLAQPNADITRVTGFASPAYALWQPGKEYSKARLVQSAEAHANVAMLMMFAHVLEQARDAPECVFRFFFCSKDAGAQTMKYILERSQYRVQVVLITKGWEELKLYLE